MKKTLIIDKPEYKAYATNIDSTEDVEIHITNKTNKVLLLEYEDKEEAEENLITQNYELIPFETLTIYSIYVGINDVQSLANDSYVIKGGDL